MYTYSFIQWVCFFYLYCFVGWVLESAYVSICKRRLVNRGFMRGPLLPLYGFGAIVMLFVTLPVRESIVLTFLFGGIGATILEYGTGVVMEALFKVRYWDYSNQPFQFQGHICLGTSLSWAALSVFLTRVLHRPVERLVLAIPEEILTPCLYGITIVTAIDFTLSVKAALDLRDVMVKFEKAKKELALLHKRLDVAIAFTEDMVEKKRQEHNLKMESSLAALEERFENYKKTHARSTWPEEVEELRERFLTLRSRKEQLFKTKGVHKRQLLLNNPSIHSERFKEALELLKGAARERDSEQESGENNESEEKGLRS